MAAGFLAFDGTVEFYGRVCALLKPTDTVLNLGAGRGAWYFEDTCEYRRSLRDLKQKVRHVYGADVDPIVFTNPATSENLLIQNDRIPLSDQSVDLVIADYVFEHIQNPTAFCLEIIRVLRPNGYLCARTPHKYCYISLGARLIRNTQHADVLSVAQPRRKVSDIFPTVYRLNTIRDIRRHFNAFEDYSYSYVSEPQYYCESKYMYFALKAAQRLMPTVLSSNIFVFMRKPQTATQNV
jgi:SAM-dependent methyltransferase